jgi:hypothetical protein
MMARTGPLLTAVNAGLCAGAPVANEVSTITFPAAVTNHVRVAVRDAKRNAADRLGGSHLNAAAEIDHARLRSCRARAE